MKYDRQRAARIAIRTREKAELARLRLELGEAKERRKQAVRDARALCKRGRLLLRDKIKAKREALKLEAASARKAERGACRARKALAKSSGARSVAAVKIAILAERRAQKTQRLRAGETVRRTASEAAAESHEAVLRDIPPELTVVWRKMANRFKGGSGGAHARAVRFLEWAEENPGEVVALQEADADREIARLVREHQAMAKKSRMRKTKAEIARELAAVPF
ncbi:MAG TPA: hypothetical protein VNG33_10115 [Polyangiaceae bacterium]|nr:hypothetical protein [Polyangiaceae bacterium]